MIKHPELLSDGLLQFGKITTQRDKEAKIIGQAFEALGGLFFNFQSIRQSDFEQYGTTESGVDLKVKTYYTAQVETSHKIIIDGIEYEITAIDPDRKRIYMYWYLSKVGKLDESLQLIRSD